MYLYITQTTRLQRNFLRKNTKENYIEQNINKLLYNLHEFMTISMAPWIQQYY